MDHEFLLLLINVSIALARLALTVLLAAKKQLMAGHPLD